MAFVHFECIKNGQQLTTRKNMTEHKIIANNGSSIVLYTTEGGNTQLEVKLENDSV